MSCACGSEEVSRKKLKKLQRKYDVLRKDHKRLVGVAVELTHALEDYVRGNETPDIRKTLKSCSTIYPRLFDCHEDDPVESPVDGSKQEEPLQEPPSGSGQEPDKAAEDPANTEQEYLEGFWSRPRIPRTPQQ